MVIAIVVSYLNKPNWVADKNVHVFYMRLGKVNNRKESAEQSLVLTCIIGTVWIELAPLPMTATFSPFHSCSP
jgi:hypothetical protein